MANSPNSLARRALLPIAVLQLVVPTLPALGLGNPIGDSPGDAMLRAPETPPGVFFAIWGLIFSSYLGFAIWANTSRDSVIERLVQPLVIAGAASIIWMVMRQARLNDFLVHLVLIVLFLAAYVAAKRFDETRGTGGSPGRWITDVATGLLAGWMTLALALSTTELVRNLSGLGKTDAEWWFLALTLLIAGSSVLFAFSRITASPYFVAALAWGLVGVVSNLWSNVELHVPAVLTGLFAGVLLYRRFRLGASGARATPRL